MDSDTTDFRVDSAEAGGRWTGDTQDHLDDIGDLGSIPRPPGQHFEGNADGAADAPGQPLRAPGQALRAYAPAQGPGRQTNKRTGLLRWRTSIIALLVLAVISPSGWSYGAALAARGNVSLSIRTVEWIRDHHGAWLVNDIENYWYNHHKPKKGGVPKFSFALGTSEADVAPGRTQYPPGTPPAGIPPTAQAPAHLPPPAPIPPIVSSPLPGEGQWHPLGQPVNGVPGLYSAYLRPDPVYTSLVTGVAWMDPTLVRTVLYAGVQEPGGGGWHYQAPVAPTDRSNLLAAFNSGFKMRDAQGGYFAEGRVVQPMRVGAATLAIKADGTPLVGQWGRDINMTPDIVSARQNLSLIVDHGQPVPDINSGGTYKWGATLGNKVLVWRSGVGVAANGALVYAGGNNLSAASLAGVLARAGAVRAMELDINSAWVDFFTYGPPAPGQPASNPTVTKLLPDMSGSSYKYLSANSRDFFAIFRR